MVKNIIIVGIMVLIATSGFAAGHQSARTGVSATRQEAHDQGYANAKKDFALQIDSFGKQAIANDQLRNDYNKLVSDYNNLQKQSGTVVYQQREPISCTSMTYGTYSNFTSTSCY